LLLALTTTPSPLPTPGLRDGISEDQVTPGLWGFIMTAFFVLATTLLIVDMVRRIRRVRYRAQVEEERQAAAEAADIEAADDHDGFGAAGESGSYGQAGPAAQAAPAAGEPNSDAGRTER
jgi:uncharacterized membrane protein YcjF (UPF0283 family)